MKSTMIKTVGATFTAANNVEAERLTRFKNGEAYDVEVKSGGRNRQFHKKVFTFFNYCFNYWVSNKPDLDEPGQFDYFRKELTILAGFSNEFYAIDGSVRVEAQSLSYANMDQDEFEQFYSALINAAMRTLFFGCGPEVEERLMGFF